ncbi:MAG: glutathione S-transferase N-terminal domain-containing protein, partial [Propylenella sp.]
MAHTQTKPIELHYWPTPNGWKITILFEELGVPYEIKYVNIGKGEQFRPGFLAMSPNNRMPAILDPEGPGGKPISVFESAAIMLYIGRKFGRFYPVDERKRVAVEEWLTWQIANVGPVFGHDNHFRHYAPEKVPYAIKRFGDESHRLYGVLNKQLEGREFVADEYSIADMALIGWVKGYERREIDIAEFPNVKRWIDMMLARPAVAKGIALGSEMRTTNLATDKEA